MNPPAKRDQLIRCITLLLPVAIYLLLTSLHVGDAFSNDETWEFYASRTLLERGQPLTVTGETNVLHPHGYYYLVKQAFRIFSISEASARSVGILAAVLCYFLLIRMIRVLRGEVQPSTVLLVGLFYLLSPLVVQGSLVITADTGIHQLVLMIFLLYFIERYPFKSIDALLLPLLFALTLWVKFVNPCLVLGSMVLFFALKKDWKQALFVTFVVGAGGFLIFFGFWTLHCLSLNSSPLEMFAYLWKVLVSRRPGPEPLSRAIQVGRGAALLAVWLGLPYLLLMLKTGFHFSKRERLAKQPPLLGLLVVTGTVLLVGHTAISGVGFGFPRYHYAMLPIWAVLVTLYIQEVLRDSRWNLQTAALAVGLPAVYLILLVQDPLYLLNYELKLSFLNLPDQTPHSFAWIAWKGILFVMPLAVALAVAFRMKSASRTAAALLILTISYSLYLNILQARAGYATNYCYGQNGTSEMLSYCTDRLEAGKTVVAPTDVIYHLDAGNYMEEWRWDERDDLLQRIQHRDTQFIVMAVNHNTIGQIRRMHCDSEIREKLDADYRRFRIGSYILWERYDSME